MENVKDTKNILPERLVLLRNQKHMTQVNLATLVGVSQESISSMERGVTNPKTSVLVKLAEVLECSLDYLVGTSDVKNPATSYDLLDGKQQCIVNDFKKCDNMHQEILLLLARIFSNKKTVLQFDDETILVKNFIPPLKDEDSDK